MTRQFDWYSLSLCDQITYYQIMVNNGHDAIDSQWE